MSRRSGNSKGFFRQGASFLQGQIRQAAGSRGFAQARLLTHWEEIVGPDIAAIARPVKVGYPPRGGLGATLTVLTTGAQAPLLEMQKEALRERVNSVYGYNAIAQIRVTQTAPTGFADGQASFDHHPARKRRADPAPTAETTARAEKLAHGVFDPNLRAALENLGRNVLSRDQEHDRANPNSQSER